METCWILFIWTALSLFAFRFPSFSVAKSVILHGSRCGGSSGRYLEIKRTQRFYLYLPKKVFCQCGDTCGGVVKSLRSRLSWLAGTWARGCKGVIYFCDILVFVGFLYIMPCTDCETAKMITCALFILSACLQRIVFGWLVLGRWYSESSRPRHPVFVLFVVYLLLSLFI